MTLSTPSELSAQLGVLEILRKQSTYEDVTFLISLLAGVLCLSVAVRWFNGGTTIKQGSVLREPPVYPSSIPLIGHFLMMAWDSPKFISSVWFGSSSSRFVNVPARLKLLVTDMYVISGSENIQAVWKEPNLHNRAYKSLAVVTMCKMPKETLNFWMSDDSGHLVQPHPDSNVPAHLRVDYLTHSSVSKFLTGPGLKPFADRFAQNLKVRLLHTNSVDSKWSNHPDLFAFMQNELFPAAVEAMCGTRLFSINPDFVHDFWEFNRNLPLLAKGYPRWLVPAAYRARDKCIKSLKNWHSAISSNFETPPSGMEAWSPEYGAEIVKFRHHMWSKMPRIGADGAATEDLGMIWAANGNSIPNSFWMVAEVIRDPTLLAKVRSIIAECRLESDPGSLAFDFARLCNEPLLQSVYAETLRLHVASFLFRGPDRKDFNLRGWCIPRDAPMLISSYNAQMDPQVWAPKGKPHARPVEEFYAERFLEVSEDGAVPESPEFSLKGRASSWIPYGGGQRMCPGRHFAKQEMISSLAIMLTLFDIETLDPDNRIPADDMLGFGFGALWPKGPMPVRMRRRRD